MCKYNNFLIIQDTGFGHVIHEYNQNGKIVNDTIPLTHNSSNQQFNLGLRAIANPNFCDNKSSTQMTPTSSCNIPFCHCDNEYDNSLRECCSREDCYSDSSQSESELDSLIHEKISSSKSRETTKDFIESFIRRPASYTNLPFSSIRYR